VSGPELDLTGPEAEELLRPAAELAIELARAGTRAQPPLEVPRSLRPLVGHAKVTRAALATARRVLEADPAFRARASAAVELPEAGATLGRASVLWLSRPEGWEEELASLLDVAREAATTMAEQSGERRAQRRLRHAEEARERAERLLDEARHAADAARGELLEERRLRRADAATLAQAQRHAASLEEQLRAAHRQTASAAQRASEHAASAAEEARALATADGELQRLRTEVEDLQASAAAAIPPSAAPPPPGPAPGVDLADLADLGRAVAAASAAALDLSDALARAASALGPAQGPPPAEAEALAPERLAPAATRPRWARSARRGTRRRAVRLPPLVLDDSAEAADHLVGLPNVAVLVDGYNATLTAWPGLPLPEQRLRLIDALAELAARTGARPEVVFDGAEVGPGLRSGTGPRSLVKVSFTPPDVEADDILIARAHARALPVVVASDDQRVRAGARAAGANVLGIGQLLAALRRKPG